MEEMQFLHMNKGEAEASYAKNCTVQRKIISYGITILEEAVSESVQNTLPRSMGIADLGCSTGPNTFMVMSKIARHVHNTCHVIGLPLPELRLSLNDLPANDFNDVFMSLPEFYENIKRGVGIGSDKCFVSAVAGSFYGRLFPRKSLHFVHSSSSLHWLSQVSSWRILMPQRRFPEPGWLYRGYHLLGTRSPLPREGCYASVPSPHGSASISTLGQVEAWSVFFKSDYCMGDTWWKGQRIVDV